MRVTQQMLFSRYVNNLNTSLTSLMDLNMKSQTQKKINKPSDDPTGMTRILDHRDTLRSLDQYKESMATAKGWLTSSDEAFMQVSTILTRVKELATQAATGTMTDKNREQLSFEMRSLFEQLVGLANSNFEDKYIYGGHKVDNPPFEKIMWLTSNDDSFAKNVNFTVNGSAEKTVLVQYYDTTGATAVGGNMNLSDPNLGVRYSTDGGKSWHTDGSVTFVGGEGTMNLPKSGTGVTFHNDAAVKVNNPDDEKKADGTWLWIRPSARYKGDDDDAPPLVDSMGAGSNLVNAAASGAFLDRNVTVRIDNASSVGMDEDIQYSYSLDGGISWVTGNVAPADTTSNSAVLSVANGGILTLTSNGSNQLQPGQQFVIHPRAAAIKLNISGSEKVQINDVGKNIFGGIYMNPNAVLASGGNSLTLGSLNSVTALQGAGEPKMGVTVEGRENNTRNMFEVVGNLVAFMETNNQNGIQQQLASLKEVHSHLVGAAAQVGGRKNRLDVAGNIVDGLKLNESALISSIEDADVSELMTQLTQQQIVYESVLRSTSMIMQLNLSKFI